MSPVALLKAPIEPASCELMGFESLIMQGFLGAIAIAMLLLKRKHENPRRPWRIWSFDVGKQVIGALLVHFLNVLASIVISGENEPDLDDNPCTWYFLNILFDTTIGIPILWCTLWYVYMEAYRWDVKDIMSGEYGNPPRTSAFIKQLILYVIAVILAKIILGLVLFYVPFLDDWGAYLISWTAFDKRVQIAFVMLIFPTIMNTIQYYVVDSIIQSPQFGSASNTITDTERLAVRNYVSYGTFKPASDV